MVFRYFGLNLTLALPLPVWRFISLLDPWQQALVVLVGIPALSLVFYVALGPVIGLHEGLKEKVYEALTGQSWPRPPIR